MRLYLLAGIFGLCSLAHAGEITIESKALTPVSAPVDLLIRKYQSEYEGAALAHCALVGAPVNQVGLRFNTVSGCDVGGPAGPVWITWQDHGKIMLVLEVTAYSITTQGSLSHGLPGLVASSGTATTWSESTWQYDGNRYARVAKRLVDLTDPQSCRANPDICDAE